MQFRGAATKRRVPFSEMIDRYVVNFSASIGPQFQRTENYVGAISSILMVLGYIMLITGWIWILVLAFQDEVLWGIVTFIFPIVGIWIVVKNWPDSKTPLLIYLGGIVLVILAAVTAGGAASA